MYSWKITYTLIICRITCVQCVYVIFTFSPSLYRWSARRRGSKERQEAQDVWCWSFGTFKLVRNPFSSHFLLKYTHYCTYMYMYSYFYNLSFPFVAFLFFSCSNISFSSLFSFFVLSLPPSLPPSLYLPPSPSPSLSLMPTGQIVSIGDPTKRYTKMEKIGQG